MSPFLQPTAFAADRVFDGRQVLHDHAVLVEGGAISALTPAAALPDGICAVREPDTTILPGLMDAHAHFMRWEGPVFLAYGVTTIRDVGNELEWILGQRERQTGSGPRILCTGPLIDGPDPLHPFVSRACCSAEEALAAVRETADAGVDGIKLYNRLCPEWLPAMVAEAHRWGLRASMHCQGSGMLVAIRAGIDECYHLDGILVDIWPGPAPGWLECWGLAEFGNTWESQQRFADELARSGVVTTPTLGYWDIQWRLSSPEKRAAAISPHVPAEMARWQAPRVDVAYSDQWRRALEAAQRFVGLLLERSAPVLAGPDAPCGALTPGLSLWRELELLVEAGMSPLQALRAATLDVAEFIGRPDLGRLEPGSAADLVVVRGDPTKAIPAEPQVVTVMRDGVISDPAKLLANAPLEAHDIAADPWGRQFLTHWQNGTASPP